MGKRHFKGGNNSEEKKRRKDNAEKWKNTRGDENNRNPWILENARFDAFYGAQKFIHGEEDWNAFLKHLQSPLPACFRIWPDYAFVDELKKQLLEFVGKKLVLDGAEIQAVEPLHWYPGGVGYKLGTDRRSIRKLEGLNDLHKWMMQHTENGNITRQEAVSMVPPLALNVSPHHRCLDMCAAPGSKTSQLLEIVNRSLSDEDANQGLVVANDADTDRAYMLVHQCRRINSPLLVVTTHKGQNFPTVCQASEVATPKPSPFFDRVLCDVPCSGDGTLRKNPAIWNKWSTSGGMTLHPLQLMIAQRGLQLLQEGGLMVYSTCSMSPYENESVIAELLRNAKGGLELVDARQFLPLFKCRAGLTEWYVLDDFYAVKKEIRKRKYLTKKQKEAGASAPESKQTDETATGAAPESADAADGDEAAEQEGADAKEDFSSIADPALRKCLELGMSYFPDFASVPVSLDRKIRKSMFPPTEEEKAWMHLEKCLRCVPQDEDTGGFFVATLRKVPAAEIVRPGSVSAAEASAPVVEVEVAFSAEECAAADAAAAAGEGEEGCAPKQSHHAASGRANRGLVDFHQWDLETFQKINDFYGFKDSLSPEAFYIREDFVTSAQANGSTTGAKSVYFIPSSARDLMHGDKDARLKVVTAGVKTFEKKVLRSGDVDYRLLQDGISFLEPFITKRKVDVTIQDFCNMLGGGLVSYSTLTGDFINALNKLTTGIVICTYDFRVEDMILPEGSTDLPATTNHKFYAVCWKGNSRAINVMCGKVEIDSIKHQLAALKVLRPKVAALRASEGVAEAVVASTVEVDATAELEVQPEEEGAEMSTD